jgi:hypothetical protein
MKFYIKIRVLLMLFIIFAIFATFKLLNLQSFNSNNSLDLKSQTVTIKIKSYI